MWSDSSRNSIEIASDERRDLARALLECSHRKAHPPRLDPQVCAAWKARTWRDVTVSLVTAVLPSLSDGPQLLAPGADVGW